MDRTGKWSRELVCFVMKGLIPRNGRVEEGWWGGQGGIAGGGCEDEVGNLMQGRASQWEDVEVNEDGGRWRRSVGRVGSRSGTGGL